MMNVSLKALLAKLNSASRASLESAIQFCMSKKKATVDLENWLAQLCGNEDSAFYCILSHYGVNIDDFLRQLYSTQLVNNSQSSGVPSLSKELVDIMQDGWTIASVEFGATYVHSGHLLLALLSNLPALRSYREVVNQLKRINLPELKENFSDILKNCSEAKQTSDSSGKVANSSGALEAFTTDLIEQARNNKIDRAIGRKPEVNQAIDVLCRRKQNNPILVGDAGVGKTAIVEELAFRIAEGSVPDLLKDVSLRVLDLTALQAGASIKGEFEQRLKNMISELKSSPQRVLLFIDEIHNLMGVGSGTAGQNDAANLLKPELARGDIYVIGATTWAEYKKYFEKDAALTRRFQLIKVKEPDIEEAIFIVRNAANLLEKHHGVKILNEAVEECVRLTARYLINLRLPDKAISLLDSACAKVKLEQEVQPLELQKMQEQMLLIDQHIERIATEAESPEKLEEIRLLEQQKAEIKKEYQKQKEVWESKASIIKDLKSLSPEEEAYKQTQDRLKKISGEFPVVYEHVSAEVIADILSNLTGIPIPTSGTAKDDIMSLLELDKKMRERVIGQDHAIDQIVRSIKISRANIADPRKPIGVFLLVGGSGIGKTETALGIAESLYGSSRKVITINMSEFKEPHKISSLIGSPPGYVGYGEGGKLTEQVRRNPYSVVLLDEMEKAHPDVQELFLQVFDKGTLTDSEGVEVNFKNTIIIMTSNLGASKIAEYCSEKKDATPDEINEYINSSLLQVFKPEFLGRVNAVPYYPLNDSILEQIIKIQLAKIEERVMDGYKAQFNYTKGVVKKIIEECKTSIIGARAIEQIITNQILANLSMQLLEASANGHTPKEITLKHNKDKFLFAIA